MAKSKLLLIRDVEDLGRSGDVVSVAPGYARNYLLPGRRAVIADAGTLKMQAKLQEETKKRVIVEKKEAEELASKMEGMVISTHVKVDHEGHMYGSVSSGDIAALIADQHGFNLEKRNIQLKHAIKEVGVFEIPIKLKEGVMSGVTVKIIPEEQHPQAAL
jgi:large subunit ribosomal protein L9